MIRERYIGKIVCLKYFQISTGTYLFNTPHDFLENSEGVCQSPNMQGSIQIVYWGLSLCNTSGSLKAK
jgi:hypothetical protein